MIKEIVLHNFKSYAGEQRVGPFHKVAAHSNHPRTRHHRLAQCFSAVVGPNGSGKSNVIDAMLFVFGKKAKQVRGACLRTNNTPAPTNHAPSCDSTKSASSSTTLPTTPTWTRHASQCTFRRS